ncbi:unnamed protein product [Rotaria socialis]|uniref:Uncharacterized protein n=1 Tax=Rotaria socialis TaxID=392032 RepID=A0A818GWL0_9BILA|nr:unnamed protein product [Rotaria socialis]
MTTSASTPSASTETIRAVTATTSTATKTTTTTTEKISASVSTTSVITATTTRNATTEMATTKTTTTTTTSKKMTTSVSTTSAIRTATTRKTTRKVTTTTSTATATTTAKLTSRSQLGIIFQRIDINSYIGHLLCALTWSPPIEVDLVVTTPTGKTMYDITSTDLSYFDGGLFEGYGVDYKELDTVYWPIDGSLPPSGTYYVCSAIYSNSSITSSKNPLRITSYIVRPSGAVLTMTRTFAFPTNRTFVCTKNSSYLIGSFIYP